MKLVISRVEATEAAPFLASRLSTRTDTSGGLQSVAEKIDGCQCFRVNDEAGALVGYYALSVILRASGAEVVIAAAAGTLAVGDLTATLLPFVEGQALGAKLMTVHTRRKGLLAKLRAAGWDFGGYIMHKGLA